MSIYETRQLPRRSHHDRQADGQGKNRQHRTQAAQRAGRGAGRPERRDRRAHQECTKRRQRGHRPQGLLHRHRPQPQHRDLQRPARHARRLPEDPRWPERLCHPDQRARRVCRR